MKNILKIPALFVMVFAGGTAVFADAGHESEGEHGQSVTKLLMPIMNSSRGMNLFVDKGCVSCHSVNGVGGEDAVSLDAHNMDEYMNPFDLAAKMWSMAPFMIEAQEGELGGQIFFTGDELGDIIAFLHDDVQQHEFTVENLSDEAREMIGGHDDSEEDGDHDD